MRSKAFFLSFMARTFSFEDELFLTQSKKLLLLSSKITHGRIHTFEVNLHTWTAML